jgi:hypothetical protein
MMIDKKVAIAAAVVFGGALLIATIPRLNWHQSKKPMPVQSVKENTDRFELIDATVEQKLNRPYLALRIPRHRVVIPVDVTFAEYDFFRKGDRICIQGIYRGQTARVVSDRVAEASEQIVQSKVIDCQILQGNQ